VVALLLQVILYCLFFVGGRWLVLVVMVAVVVPFSHSLLYHLIYP
jgi:hypothetical protein